jgi:hypothetical protein
MNTNTFKSIARPVLAAALATAVLAGLTACAVAPPQTPEEAVRDRATERWQALIFGKFDRSYQLHAPSFRKDTSYDKYFSGISNNMQWTGVEVYGVKCEAAKCSVRLNITLNSPLPQRIAGPISNALDETWVLEDGQWWFGPRQ